MLQLDHVTVRFGGLTAVNDVSLNIEGQQIVGLVGPNGAGKTTLFNVISGLVRPTSGRVLFNGEDIVRQPLYRRARIGLGRTFQIPQPMHELTVRENLIVAQRFGAGKVNERRVDEILDFLELGHAAERHAATDLALQELKRLEVAKALATEPKMLLLDEVLAGLETSGKRLFMSKLRDLHQQFKIGIVIVEHDIETISSLCQRVVVLNFGALLADGTPREVFDHPDVIASYTGETTHA
ncbi:ABC transporter ATP-binding protein [Aquabacterium soli]|jgi:branched-chain amino acid transport system ATP-binding protein|uniref:ABC transporter ATP-binding protein n=1 Tax=Aquabacterium soli TaxID=2493092 RepID=A0A3R8TE96_9BURK|nr:ABC transporter ATP-binding protein [Aquabacterium soli]RRS05623.1 ABC transporter ATP-binding protein [Aquabacterium soli]